MKASPFHLVLPSFGVATPAFQVLLFHLKQSADAGVQPVSQRLLDLTATYEVLPPSFS